MNTDPNTIGYWARVNNLTWDDVAVHHELGDNVTGPDSRLAFAKGWNQADEELLQERLAKLVEDLKEAKP